MSIIIFNSIINHNLLKLHKKKQVVLVCPTSSSVSVAPHLREQSGFHDFFFVVVIFIIFKIYTICINHLLRIFVTMNTVGVIYRNPGGKPSKPGKPGGGKPFERPEGENWVIIWILSTTKSYQLLLVI